jgi:hypothetical protein
MSDEIKTNEIVEEVVENEVNNEDLEEMTELDHTEEVSQDDTDDQENLEEVESKPKKKVTKDAFIKVNPKTGKKQLKGWLVTIITIVTIIAVLASAISITLAAMGSKNSDSKLGAAPETFGDSISKNSDVYTSYEELIEQYKAEIEAGMAEDATDEQKVLAAYILYRIASMADYNAPEKAKYSTGGGRATGELTLGETVMTVGGGMNMTSTYYTILDKGNKYCAQEEYTQVPAGSVEASEQIFIDAGEAALPAFLGFARRTISTPDETITWGGKNESSVITETGVTGKFEDKANKYKVLTAEEAKEAAKKYERVYGEDWGDAYGGKAPDLSIHVINQNTIIADSVEITKELLSDYYTVKFDVDVNAIVGQGVDAEGNPYDIHTTWYAEQLYLANAGLDFLNSLGSYSLRYSELKVEMTVFDNGYIRTWATNETWIMSANITHDIVVSLFDSASAKLTSKNESYEVYCYNHDTIMQGFVNRWIGDNEKVGKPMADLPFADKLAGYEKQEYGTYR